MLVDARVLVTTEIAESLPSRPDRVQACVLEAENAMTELARERNRRLAEKPRLTDARETGLGFVELSFIADTESD